MFKPSIFSLFIGAACLSSGCIVTSNDDGGTNTSNSSDPTNGGDTGGQTSNDPSNGDDDDTTSPGETTDAEDDETTDAADETGETGEPVGPCGWGMTNDPEVPEGYVCGGDGEDPDARFAMECPADLEEGARCGQLTGVGCCDDEGNVWFCWDVGGDQTIVKETCG